MPFPALSSFYLLPFFQSSDSTSRAGFIAYSCRAISSHSGVGDKIQQIFCCILCVKMWLTVSPNWTFTTFQMKPGSGISQQHWLEMGWRFGPFFTTDHNRDTNNISSIGKKWQEADSYPQSDSLKCFMWQTITGEIDSFQSLGQREELSPRSWAVSGRALSAIVIPWDIQMYERLNTTRRQCSK